MRDRRQTAAWLVLAACAWSAVAAQDVSTLFHRGDGTYASASASDASLTVTDVTTNNVTTSAHGFVPKGTNTTTSYLRDDGAWVVNDGTVFPVGNTAGNATTTQHLVAKLTGIADNTATAIITVTVPNVNGAALFRGFIIGTNGSTDAFKSTRSVDFWVTIDRLSGSNVAKTLASNIWGSAATVSSGLTSLSCALSSTTGASSATQTFTLNVTIDDVNNLGSNQAVFEAWLMNAQAGGITMTAP